MKKIIMVVAVMFFASVSGAYAEPAKSAKEDAQAYTPIAPATLALAEWVGDYKTAYNEHGIYKAVADVVNDGRPIKEIVSNGLDFQVNPQHLVAALYCARVNPEDIRKALEDVGASEDTLLAGFKTAQTVCGDVVTDALQYTPVATGFAGAAGASDGGGMTYGSPSSP